MKEDMPSRPDLVGEVRLRIPLPIVIPLAAVAVIAVIAFGFSRVLLALPSEAATTVAIVTAANVLIASAFIARRPRMHRAGLLEVALIAIYPILVGVVIAVTGIGTSGSSATAPQSDGQEQQQPGAGAPGGGGAPAPGGGATATLVAQNVSWSADQITLPATTDVTVTVDNQDATIHNFAVFASEKDATSGGKAIFQGPNVDAGTSMDYKFKSPAPGTYYFECEIHPTMNGDVVVK